MKNYIFIGKTLNIEWVFAAKITTSLFKCTLIFTFEVLLFKNPGSHLKEDFWCLSQSYILTFFFFQQIKKFNKEASWLHAELFFCAGFHVVSWTLHGVHVRTMLCPVETMWFPHLKPCSVHLKTTWCPPENHMVSTWKPHGIHMETMWYPPGNYVVFM